MENQSELRSEPRSRLETFRNVSKHFLDGSRCASYVRGCQGGQKPQKLVPQESTVHTGYKGQSWKMDRNFVLINVIDPKTFRNVPTHFLAGSRCICSVPGGQSGPKTREKKLAQKPVAVHFVYKGENLKIDRNFVLSNAFWLQSYFCFWQTCVDKVKMLNV